MPLRTHTAQIPAEGGPAGEFLYRREPSFSRLSVQLFQEQRPNGSYRETRSPLLRQITLAFLMPAIKLYGRAAGR